MNKAREIITRDPTYKTRYMTKKQKAALNKKRPENLTSLSQKLLTIQNSAIGSPLAANSNKDSFNTQKHIQKIENAKIGL